MFTANLPTPPDILWQGVAGIALLSVGSQHSIFITRVAVYIWQKHRAVSTDRLQGNTIDTVQASLSNRLVAGFRSPKPYTFENTSGLCRQVHKLGNGLCHNFVLFNLLKPKDIYTCRNAALTSRRYILNIYSTNIHTEYFKHAA